MNGFLNYLGVKKVAKQKIHWEHVRFIKMLYVDGTGLSSEYKDSKDLEPTMYNFVDSVYKEAGGNQFFDDFIKKNYKRELIKNLSKQQK